MEVIKRDSPAVSCKPESEGRLVMKHLSLILLLVSFTANSSDLSAPKAAAEKFFQYFNAKDIESLNNASGPPFIFAAGGEVIR
tara:strand:+ start:535 stop:783 length:249 start_codon:yes stop_codon:yes gene_type:complete